MNRAAWIAAFVVAALVTGCGGDRGAGTGPPEPPRIEAVDEPAPPELESGFRDLGRILATRDVPPEKREFVEAIAPAPDAQFRVVARLRLSEPRRGIVLELVAWKSRAGALCTVAVARTAAGGEAGGAGPNGPCVPVNRCRSLCVEQGLIEVAERGSTIVAGTVGSDADELRLVFLGGRERRIPLDGPFLAGDPSRRVFLLDLGRSSYTRAELVRDGHVVERREESAYDYATEDCIEKALERDREPGEAGCF